MKTIRIITLLVAASILPIVSGQYRQNETFKDLDRANSLINDASYKNMTVANDLVLEQGVRQRISDDLLEISSVTTDYKNPIFEPDMADPCVIRAADGWFYAYGTENTWTDGVHHLVPIIKSQNLIQWQFVKDAFTTRPAWKSPGGIWAPDVSYLNGKYYMYYALSTWGDSNPGIGLAISNQPWGPFVDQGKVFDNSIGVSNSIDPFFFQTGTGVTLKSFLFWGSFSGIYGIELGTDFKTMIGNKFKIAGNAFEASSIREKDGKFYFFGSSGSCCNGINSQYQVNVASANNIKGPYFDKTGAAILIDGQFGSTFLSGNISYGWVGPGHNSKIITDDAGNDFFIYHAIDVTKQLLPGGATRRPMMMDRINWINGWPSITGNLPSKVPCTAPVIITNTGIKEIISGVTIVTLNNRIRINNTSGNALDVSVYRTNGCLIQHLKITRLFSLELKKGVYIVKTTYGKKTMTQKILI